MNNKITLITNSRDMFPDGEKKLMEFKGMQKTWKNWGLKLNFQT